MVLPLEIMQSQRRVLGKDVMGNLAFLQDLLYHSLKNRLDRAVSTEWAVLLGWSGGGGWVLERDWMAGTRRQCGMERSGRLK